VNKTALIGAGDLGSALLSYPGFSGFNLDIVAAFDSNPKKIGKTKNNIQIEDVSKLNTLRQRGIKLAIVAVPATAAQKVVDNLVENGIAGILNFAPCYLVVPKRVKVISIDIATYLACLPYYLSYERSGKG
jgi:redox-sensing transcriptional repressor